MHLECSHPEFLFQSLGDSLQIFQAVLLFQHHDGVADSSGVGCHPPICLVSHLGVRGDGTPVGFGKFMIFVLLIGTLRPPTSLGRQPQRALRAPIFSAAPALAEEAGDVAADAGNSSDTPIFANPIPSIPWHPNGRLRELLRGPSFHTFGI